MNFRVISVFFVQNPEGKIMQCCARVSKWTKNSSRLPKTSSFKILPILRRRGEERGGEERESGEERRGEGMRGGEGGEGRRGEKRRCKIHHRKELPAARPRWRRCAVQIFALSLFSI